MIYRFKKRLQYLALGIVLVYMSLSIFNQLGSVSVSSRLSTSIEELPKENNVFYPVKIKALNKNGEHKVDIVLTVDRDEFVKAIDATIWGSYQGEFTSNPLPINTTFLIDNRNACKGIPDLKFIIYVHSNPPNKERRNIIRSTWASKDLFKKQITQLVFLVGVPDNDEHQSLIEKEHRMHGDIVQGNFRENYRNITLKGIMGLKWVSQYCREAAHVIKADDDAFVNIFKLMDFVEEHKNKRHMLMCALWKEHTMSILRDPANCAKWCVKYNEFPGREYFPKYCAGLSYIMSRELIPELYQASLSTPFFWIDDVYVTGMLTPKVKHVTNIDILRNFTLKPHQLMDQYLEKAPVSYLMAHATNPAYFLKLWNATLDRLKEDAVDELGGEVFTRYPYLLKRKTIITELPVLPKKYKKSKTKK